MNHEEVGRFWNANADSWTKLARTGYDVYRDYLNTPGFFDMLPNVAGLAGLDIGCGEGHNTRLFATSGGTRAIGHRLSRRQRRVPPFSEDTFDFATAFMSFMDIPETDRVLAEARRILKPCGFLQFSISHPCFDTPHRRNLRDARGLTYAIEVGEYFRNLDGEVEEWLFGAAPLHVKQGLPKFKTPRFTRTLSQWLNLLIDAGFWLERVAEPRPSDATVRACPDVQDAQVAAYFLHIRVRKPEKATTSAGTRGEQGVAS